MMRKIIFTLLTMVAMTLNAQTIDHGAPSRMWTVPAVFSVDQEVTFYFDMTDTGFKEAVDLYLWCWNPSEPDAGNWENSSDFAKLTYEGDNIYSMTMVPTEYFSSGASTMSAQEVYNYCQTADWPGFWSRLKTKDGSEESDVFQAPDSRSEWEDFKSSGSAYKFYSGIKATGFTEAFTIDQHLNIVLDPAQFTVAGVSMNNFTQKAGFESFQLHSGLDDWTYLQNVAVWVPECMELTKISKQTNGYYTISMKSPYDYYHFNVTEQKETGLETDTEIENLAWLVVGIINGDWGGTSADQSTKAGQAVPYPDPSFSFFPSTIGLNDIITLTRQYNEKTAGELTYEITAGGKTITGILDGNRDKREAVINLVDQFQNVSAENIEIVIKNAGGTNVEEMILPLAK